MPDIYQSHDINKRFPMIEIRIFVTCRPDLSTIGSTPDDLTSKSSKITAARPLTDNAKIEAALDASCLSFHHKPKFLFQQIASRTIEVAEALVVSQKSCATAVYTQVLRIRCCILTLRHECPGQEHALGWSLHRYFFLCQNSKHELTPSPQVASTH